MHLFSFNTTGCKFLSSGSVSAIDSAHGHETVLRCEFLKLEICDRRQLFGRIRQASAWHLLCSESTLCPGLLFSSSDVVICFQQVCWHRFSTNRIWSNTQTNNICYLTWSCITNLCVQHVRHRLVFDFPL